ncbi:TonB-dependent receptor domain-containing protein [Erythrobacter sp. THAF29]|uniref:TonB-dependent receptor domain-containing protein n=1 Tax=Erythrobacter sp. THAF29 TaxID=2587851 RepID=UPI0018F8BF89|nr:TonB-dependent receptor [Erythrobacter sp. THAF29]
MSAGSLAVGLVLSSAPAFAQDAEVTSDGDTAEETSDNQILVTGSRLNVNPNLEGASPVLSVSEEQIQAQGTVRIEDLVNQLPQVFAGQAGEVSNGASGTATLNLRGVGSVRTLVLIDGRRLPYGSSSISSANLDLIPTQLVERVDVLTGGASAVYGSDAVGGVANFILKRDFEGVEIDVQGNFQQTGNGNEFFNNVTAAAQQPVAQPIIDGVEYTFTGMIGTNTADGRGNVTLYASYERREQVTQNNRSFSACTIGASTSGSSFGGAGCVGSSNFRRFADFFVDDGIEDDVDDAFQLEDGTIVAFDPSDPSNFYNFGQRNFFQRPSERFTLYGRAHYDIADNIEAFLDISYTDVFSDAQIAESASFGIWNINCDNPLINGTPGIDLATEVFNCSAQDIADGVIKPNLFASHRNVEGGPRNSRLENSAFRIVGGLRGDFGDGIWSWEAFGQYAETSDSSLSTNDFIVANVQQAFLAVDDGNGNVVCSDPSGGCVPYNIFQRNPDGTSRVTQDQLDFIQGVGIVIGETTQLVVGANIQADLGEYGFSSPFSEEGIAFLAGVEYREDTLESIPDEISQVPGGGFTGVGGATLPVAGAVEVYEFYSELQIPLITDTPFFEELTLSGQYRYSDYTTNGNGTTNSFNTDAFGVQLTWAPVEDITLRGQFQRAVRAPNVIELFTGQNTGLPNLNGVTNSNGDQIFDPCASAFPTASQAACANTGVTAAQYGNVPDVISGQTQSITGGNPQLNPEESDTWTFGAVLTPSFIPDLTVSVDYFNITVDGFIAAGIAAQTTLDQCLATGNPTFCNLITRASNGSLIAGIPGVGFQQTNLNIAELETSGFDVQVGYRTDIDSIGGLRFDYAGTYLEKFDFASFPGDTPIECAGFLNNGCVAPVNPKYRHRAQLTWETLFGLDATVAWRHFSGTENETNPANPEIDDNLPAVNYVDLSFFADLNDVITLRGGVLNVLNEQPPVSTSSGPPLGNGNTFPTIYDTARTVFAGVNFRF